MSEGSAPSAEDAAAARAAEQARLRKERREAKIKAGGASRLNKITGLGGGLQRDPPPAPPSESPAAGTRSQPQTQPPQQHDDPAEIDISQHFYQPQATPRPPQGPMPGNQDFNEAQLRQMMLGFDGPAPGTGATAGMPGAEDVDDPMMRMMMQMLGGPNGPNGAGNPFAGGNSPFGGATPFDIPGMGQAQQVATPDRYSALWRLLHTFVALALGLYMAIWAGFTGTKLQRERGALGERSALGGDVETENGFQARHFFWAFATAEAVLLTTRFFVDRTRAPPSGILWTVAGFLPPPFKGYLEVALRYGQIFGTVKADVLVCIFVLGAASWVRGW